MKDLSRHDRGMHEEEISACEKCPYTTQYREKLEEHVKEEHSNQTRSRIFYATSRKAHRAKDDKPSHCTSCDFKSYSLEELRSRKKHHNHENVKSHGKLNSNNASGAPKFNGRNTNMDPLSTCDKCEEKFWYTDEIALHMEYFHKQKQQ